MMSIFVEEYMVIMTMIMICGKSGSVPNEAQLASLPYASSSAKLTCRVQFTKQTNLCSFT